MESRRTLAAQVDRFITLVMNGQLQPSQAEELVALGAEAVQLVLLTVSARHAAATRRSTPSPSTPSGQQPPYEKPNKSKGKKRKPGGRDGHQGARRPPPARIDDRQEVRLECCPDCGGPLNRGQRSRTRIIEDLLENIRSLATEYTIYRDYCPTCQKDVEPAIPAALPGATLGHHVVVLSAWFHYGLGLTVKQVVDILRHHLQTKITAGGLINAWQRMAEVLTGWYEQIGASARASSHLHADETSWRVNGQTWWLWCFCNPTHCYYMIDRSRGSPALLKFFTEAFDGVLITDFWQAYWAVVAADRQFCLVHLLREILEVDEREFSPCWQAFSKKLRRLLRDGIRLSVARPTLAADEYARRSRRLDARLMELAEGTYENADAQRLAKRLMKHRDHIFTFLDYEEVTFDNNFGERQIRPAVIIRKNCQNNRSERGAAVQGVLMSIFQTLRLRGLPPTQTVVEALKTYVATGQLPPLPEPATANG
jgi:transposase